ncbi:MAG: hypothetical protein FWD63_05060 [Propionibacteriaceae bacterium]|nr:hypothetical protein [Propionibacteriaceae bacterium]
MSNIPANTPDDVSALQPGEDAMIHPFGEVILFSKDPTAAVEFWTTKVGFVVVHIEKPLPGHIEYIEIAPAGEKETMRIYDKSHDDLSWRPSMLWTRNATAARSKLRASGVECSTMEELSIGKIFTFDVPDVSARVVIENDGSPCLRLNALNQDLLSRVLDGGMAGAYYAPGPWPDGFRAHYERQCDTITPAMCSEIARYYELTMLDFLEVISSEKDCDEWLEARRYPFDDPW